MDDDSKKITRQFSNDGGGIELGLAGVVFGLFGLWIDKKIGTTPVLFIGFFLFGFLGSAFSFYYRFKEQMDFYDSEAEESNE